MLEKITEAEINERSMARVSTTPGRPTAFGQSNMDPEALKLRFDRLGRFLAGKINEILGSIEDGSISKNIKIKDDDGAEYILSDFILKMIEGDLTHINVVVPEGRQRLDVICNYVLRWNNEFYTGDFANEAVVVSGVTLRKFYEEFKAFEGETAPVQSVNGKTGDVELNAEDVGARPDTWMPSAEDVGAEPVGTAAFAVETHNNNGESHQDIRRELKDLTDQMANAGAVKSVNDKTGDVTLNAEDVGARSNTWMPTAEQVGARPDNWMPSYSDVNADKAGTADSKVSAHNVSDVSHNDIRLLIQGLADRINAIANSTDVDLDDFKEVVAYIKSNRGLIDAITTNKINYTDIINDLVTNVANKPLSAAQGVALKLLIDNLTTNKLDASALTSAINTALAQAKASGEFKGEDGKTPYIQNGYWYINGASTGVKAQGNDGKGISSVAKTSTSGLVDTYTITFTDGTKTTYTVTNGKGDNVPDYIVAEAERVAKAVQTTRTGKTLVFTSMSDAHLYVGNASHDESLVSAKMGCAGIEEMRKRMHIDFVSYLGDYTWSSTTYTSEQVKKDWTAFKETTDTTNTEIWCVGNHDVNYGSGRDRVMTADEIYAYIGANSDGTKPYADIHRSYGYCDFDNQKVRVIYLNTCDVSDITPTAGSTATSEGMSINQIRWVAETALDFSDKEDSSEWGIIVMGHHPLQYLVSTNRVLKILEAYKDGGKVVTTVTIDGVTHNINYDFSNLTKRAEIICNVHGHSHNFASSKISSSSSITPWLWRFCIPNLGVSRENECATNPSADFAKAYGHFDANGNPIYHYKVSGTAEETSFCVISVDRKNKYIYAYRFGAGEDRTFNYAQDAVEVVYNITEILSNCSSSNNPTTITQNTSATLTFTANSGYSLPDSVTVTGADHTWDKASGKLTLRNPTSNVTVTVAGLESAPVVVNLLDMATRTYTKIEDREIAASAAHEMDYTKSYACKYDGSRGAYPTGKITYTHNAANNGFTYQTSSTSGYGVEFPVDVVGGKAYVLKWKETNLTTDAWLYKYNATSKAFIERIKIRDGGYSTDSVLSREHTVTPEAGYLYSIAFMNSVASKDSIITDISLTEN